MNHGSFVPFRDTLLGSLSRRDSPDAIAFVPFRDFLDILICKTNIESLFSLKYMVCRLDDRVRV